MELYRLKLELFYYGVDLSVEAIKKLNLVNGKLTFDDYITTRGLILMLNEDIFVNAEINKESNYKIDYVDNSFVIINNGKLISSINNIIQPPKFALNGDIISAGYHITNFVNVHGDRARLQPIGGCVNSCAFCDMDSLEYIIKDIGNLDEAFRIVLEHERIKHCLISGGSPKERQEDYDYLTSVYKYFPEKYKNIAFDIMMTPRSEFIGKDSIQDYKSYLEKLKSWLISGLSINLELYNDDLRKKYISGKEQIGKEKYFEFIKIAVEIFGIENIRSCVIVGLESKEDTLRAVRELSELGCIPVLSPYVPYKLDVAKPTPEFMEEVLIESNNIVKQKGLKLGPTCKVCNHNIINF